MEVLDTGTSLETLLRESQQHTILLSDLRENSEVSRKTDEKTLTQLTKLQQAASQSLEVAKEQKRQTKSDSTTLRTLHEATVNANAIIAKRQTSTLNTLCKTVDVGLNVVNQKMFSMFEKLGSSLAGAFSSVGRGIENKLYDFMGSFSILIKPVIGIVKVGFSVMTKVLSVPLKLIWEGLKAFSNTLIGKIVMFAGTLYLLHAFFTKTNIGARIMEWVEKKKTEPNSVIGRVLNYLDNTVTALKLIGGLVAGLYALNTGLNVATTVRTFRATGSLMKMLPGAAGAAAAGATMLKGRAGAAPTGTIAATTPAAQHFTTPKAAKAYLNSNGIKYTHKSNVMQMANEHYAKNNAPSVVNAGSTAAKVGKLGKFHNVMGRGGNMATMIGGMALDYAADNVENRTASGALKVGSAALEGAGTGAMIGSLFGPIGTAVGAGVGALVGTIGSLVAGEGGERLFGEDEEENEMEMLNNMQDMHDKTVNAQIKSLNDIAESIREQSKVMTQVVEKMSTDAQHDITRRESSASDAARHEDAKTQQNLTTETNNKLTAILEALNRMTADLGALTFNKTNAQPSNVPNNP